MIAFSNPAVLEPVWSLFHELWRVFDHATPFANFVGICAFFGLTLGPGTYLSRKIRNKEEAIADLRAELGTRENKLDLLRTDLKEVKKRYDSLLANQPDEVLATYYVELRSGNSLLANNVLRTWIRNSGRDISAILAVRAEWVESHAVRTFRPKALAAAKAYSIAAVALSPANTEASSLLYDIQAWIDEEGWILEPLHEALFNVDQQISEVFSIDLVREADDAEAESNNLYEQGRYSAALPLVQRSLANRQVTIGERALPTLRVQFREAEIYYHLGRFEMALAKAESLASVQSMLPELNLGHYLRLDTQYLIAKTMNHLDRSHEALSLARDGFLKSRSDPERGPDHVMTHEFQYLIAVALCMVNSNEEGLIVAKEVAMAEIEHPGMGPLDVRTLSSEYLVARLQHNLGFSDEALSCATEVARKQEELADLGPTAIDTLRTKFLIAKMLTSLEKFEEALPIAQYVASAGDRRPILGYSHPDTLLSHRLVALILHKLGRNDEALSAANQILDAQRVHPSIGLNHANTISTLELLVAIHIQQQKLETALDIAREAVEWHAIRDQASGSKRALLTAKVQVAIILDRLGQKAEALQLARQILDASHRADPPDKLLDTSVAMKLVKEIEETNHAAPMPMN